MKNKNKLNALKMDNFRGNNKIGNANNGNVKQIIIV